MNTRYNQSSRHLFPLGLLAVFAGASLPARAAPTYFDLSQPSPAPLGSALVNGAYLFSITPVTASGTGVFNTFLAYGGPSNGGSEEGYNSSLGTLMPDVADSKTDNITVSLLTSYTVLGIAYYSFGFDINESQSAATLYQSLDQLQVWVKSSPLTSSATYLDLAGSGATKIYDLDSNGAADRTVLLNSAISSSGSGQSDVLFLLPKSLVDAVATSTWNIYLYAQNGATGVVGGNNYQAEGGFEEWARVSGFTGFTPPPTVQPIPEASTVAAAGGLAVLVAGHCLSRYRRQRRA